MGLAGERRDWRIRLHNFELMHSGKIMKYLASEKKRHTNLPTKISRLKGRMPGLINRKVLLH